MKLSGLALAVTAANDAAMIVAALMPLIQGELSGGEPVTEEDVRQALAGKDAALKRLDDLIAQKGG